MDASPNRFDGRDETRMLQLFQQSVQGDPDAFWTMIEPFTGLIYSVAFGIMKDPDAACDVLHESYIKAFNSLYNLRDPHRLASWLHSMVTRISYDALRRQNRDEKNMGEVLRRGPRIVPIDEMLVKEEELNHLEKAMATLPEPFRIILGMKYMNRYTCEDIARALDINIGTVKSRLYEARKLLAKRMREQEQPMKEEMNDKRGRVVK